MHHVTTLLVISVCDLIYIELGSNRGDSLEAFVAEKPDGHVHRALMVANPSWSPAQACMYPRLRAESQVDSNAERHS